MKHIKKFVQFVNEGAWYEEEGDGIKVYLSKYNDASRENELLKTVDPNGLNFSKRGVSNIKTYFGLYPRKAYKSGNEESDAAKKFIMDLLKKNKFEMAPGETMDDFFNFTVLNNIEGDINYIVKIGSSEPLVSRMEKSLLDLYPQALVINLTKIKYEDWRNAIDWESYIKKIESEFSIPRYFERDVYYTVKEGDTLKSIAKIKKLDVNSILSFNPGLERGNYRKPDNLKPGQRILIKKEGEPAPGRSDTSTYTERWIRGMERKIMEAVARGEDPKFEIRTSGMKGSIRGVLAPKYNTANEAFIDAVSHCVFGDENGNFAKMIIIDDNINQGVDLRDVANKITQILSGVIDTTKNIAEESLKKDEVFSRINNEFKRRIEQNDKILKTKKGLQDLLKNGIQQNIPKNIFSYALYNFGPSGGRALPDKNFTLNLLKKHFYGALAEIKNVTLDQAEIMVKRSAQGYPLNEPDYNRVPLTEDEFQELYDKTLDKAAAEYENISQDKKLDIIKILKPTLDNNIKEIIFARIYNEEAEEEDDIEISKYPNLDYINVGDEVFNKTGMKGIIDSIDRGRGSCRIKVNSGTPNEKITMDLDLRTLENSWTGG